MRILILGGHGMLGHQVFKRLGRRHEVRATLRQDLTAYEQYGLFTRENAYPGVDLRNAAALLEVVADFKPQAIVNAVGIIKQRPEAENSIACLEINSLLPHRLALIAKSIGARLVHISTDCVFSGKKGNYQESDPSDAEDLYGRSKFLGEVHDGSAITLRTSIIGRELSRKAGLLEWLLAQRGTVRGFRNAIFSGLTTLELSRVIEKVLLEHPDRSGLYQVSSEPINKCDLLLLLKRVLHVPVDVIPDDAVHCNRSLDSSRFRRDFGYTPPTWEAMAQELAGERRN